MVMYIFVHISYDCTVMSHEKGAARHLHSITKIANYSYFSFC